MIYVSRSKELRQKAINILYLIFLSFIFMLLPSDFIDSTFHVNRNYESAITEMSSLNNANSIYFIHMLKEFPELSESLMTAFDEIEAENQQLKDYMQYLRSSLIAVKGYNTHAYPEDGKDEQPSQGIMINQSKADSLYAKLETYRNELISRVDEEGVERILEVLPLSQFMKQSNGEKSHWGSFFFKQTPLNVALLNLTHLESSAERAKISCMQSLIRNAVETYKLKLPEQSLKIQELIFDEDLSNTQKLSKLRKLLEVQMYQDEADKKELLKEGRFFVESLNDSIYEVGKSLSFKIEFDSSATPFVQVQVQSPDQVVSYSLNQSGMFRYLPEIKGVYTISFKSPKFSIFKKIKVIDARPVLENPRLSTLYIGIDNPLKIRTSTHENYEKLTATISKGQVFKKDGTFYVRVEEPGVVLIKVFEDMPYGLIKVAEKRFAVRKLQEPFASLGRFFDGDDIPKDQIVKLKNLRVHTDEYLLDEVVYISSFECSLIYNEHSSITKPVVNIGASFGEGIMDLISNSSPGDILLIQNIETKSSLGTERRLKNLTLHIK